MKFIQTELKGAYVIKLDKLTDERGFFTRAWDINEFEKLGLKRHKKKYKEVQPLDRK